MTITMEDKKEAIKIKNKAEELKDIIEEIAISMHAHDEIIYSEEKIKKYGSDGEVKDKTNDIPSRLYNISGYCNYIMNWSTIRDNYESEIKEIRWKADEALEMLEELDEEINPKEMAEKISQ